MTEPDCVYYTHDYNQDRVYGLSGPEPALTASDSNRTRNFLVPATTRELTGSLTQSGRVYDADGVAPTIQATSNGGGDHVPRVLCVNNGSRHAVSAECPPLGAGEGGQRTAPVVAFDPQGGTMDVRAGDTVPTLKSGAGCGNKTMAVAYPVEEPDAVAYQCHGSNVGPMGTLKSGNGGLTGGVPFVVNATYSCAKASHARESETARCLDQTGGFASQQGGTVVVNLMGANRRPDRPEGGLYVEEDATVSKCLDQTGLNPGCGQGGTAVVQAVAFGGNRTSGPLEAAACLSAKGGSGRMDFETETLIVDERPVAFSCKNSGQDVGEVSPTLRAMGHDGSHANAGGQVAIADQRLIVRRLTPRECERLQGFDDNYTLVSYRKKPAADGPRYRALGNAITVPVLRWLGERLQAEHERSLQETRLGDSPE